MSPHSTAASMCKSSAADSYAFWISIVILDWCSVVRLKVEGNMDCIEEVIALIISNEAVVEVVVGDVRGPWNGVIGEELNSSLQLCASTT